MHAAAERNGKMCEVATNTRPLLMSIPRRPVGASVRVVEVNSVVRVFKNGMYPGPTLQIAPEHRPCQVVQLLGIAIPAAKEKDQYIVWQLADGMLAFIQRKLLGHAAIADEKSVPQ